MESEQSYTRYVHMAEQSYTHMFVHMSSVFDNNLEWKLNNCTCPYVYMSKSSFLSYFIEYESLSNVIYF